MVMGHVWPLTPIGYKLGIENPISEVLTIPGKQPKRGTRV